MYSKTLFVTEMKGFSLGLSFKYFLTTIHLIISVFLRKANDPWNPRVTEVALFSIFSEWLKYAGRLYVLFLRLKACVQLSVLPKYNTLDHSKTWDERLAVKAWYFPSHWPHTWFQNVKSPTHSNSTCTVESCSEKDVFSPNSLLQVHWKYPTAY